MIRFHLAQLELAPVELEGVEPAELLDIAPSSALRIASGVRYRLTGSLVSGSLLVRGEFSYDIAGACGRCLADVTRRVAGDDLCLYVDAPAEELVDVTDAFREEVLLALPANLLCSDDCRGLCPKCGADRNRETCSCAADDAADEADSPWSALDELKLKPERKG